MREAKKLAKKRWRAGSADEFLGLSEEESRYVEMKVKLAEGLRRARLRHALTQVELAERVSSSQSRVAKMEAGDPSVTMDLLVKSLLALGMSEKDIARLLSAPARKSA